MAVTVCATYYKRICIQTASTWLDWFHITIDESFPLFLTQAYSMKAVADYETGPSSVVPPERAAAAIETAARFIDGIARVLAPGV
jgi:hypothetical protein